MRLRAILFLLLPSAMWACLNDGSDAFVGPLHIARGRILLSRLRIAMATQPNDQNSVGRFTGSAENVSSPQFEEIDAIRDVLSGDFKKAIDKLKKLEEKSTELYSTAANLGTAYELAGDNVNALKWIKEGVARNANSHFGTEWLHILVLEAKVEAAKHPEQPLKGHLLNLPERMNEETVIQVDGSSRSVKQIEEALFFQLQERMVFVKPKDVYVADLLYSYAQIEASLSTVASGRRLLNLAKEYGFADEALLQQSEKEFQRLETVALIWQWVKAAAWIAGFALFLWYCYRRKWFFLSGRAYRAHKEAMTLARQ